TSWAWAGVLGGLCVGATVRRHRGGSVSRRRASHVLLIGGFGQALITYLSLYALRYIPVGPLAFLFYTYPAWVAIIASIRGTEKLTTVRVTALMLALIGVAVMVEMPVESLNPIGVGLAFASALLYSIYFPALEHVQQGMPAMFATFWLILGA